MFETNVNVTVANDWFTESQIRQAEELMLKAQACLIMATRNASRDGLPNIVHSLDEITPAVQHLSTHLSNIADSVARIREEQSKRTPRVGPSEVG